MQTTPSGHALILHDIRSAQNVGALFRTADAIGIHYIYLSSITPQPIDRFGRERKDITKTALGAEKNISWESYTTIESLLSTLKKEGYTVVAIEQTNGSIDYKKLPEKEKFAFILGNEETGLEKKVTDSADYVIEIPMRGKKESLNVAVAGGVVLFRTLDR